MPRRFDVTSVSGTIDTNRGCVGDKVVRFTDDWEAVAVEHALSACALAAKILARDLGAARKRFSNVIVRTRSDISIASTLIPDRKDGATFPGVFGELLDSTVPDSMGT